MAPKKKSAAVAAAKAWENHQSPPADAMAPSGRATRASQRAKVVEPAQTAPEIPIAKAKAPSTRTTKKAKESSVTEPAEATQVASEAVMVPPKRATRARASSNTSNPDTEPTQEVKSTARSTRAAKQTTAQRKENTAPAPTKRTTRTRGAASVEENEPEVPEAEHVEEIAAVEIITEEAVAVITTKPVKKGRKGRKAAEEAVEEAQHEVMVGVVIDVPEAVPAVPAARSTRARNSKKTEEQPVEEEAPIAAEPPKPKRSTRTKKVQDEPVAIIETAQAQNEAEPQPTKRTRRGKAVAETEAITVPVAETQVSEPQVDDVEDADAQATAEDEEVIPPTKQTARRKKASTTSTVPVAVRRSKRAAEELAIAEELPTGRRRNTRRAKEASPESIQKPVDEVVEAVEEVVAETIEEADQDAMEEVVHETVEEAIQETVEELVQEPAPESLTENIQESVQESVQELAQMTLEEPVQEAALELPQEPVQPEEHIDSPMGEAPESTVQFLASIDDNETPETPTKPTVSLNNDLSEIGQRMPENSNLQDTDSDINEPSLQLRQEQSVYALNLFDQDGISTPNSVTTESPSDVEEEFHLPDDTEQNVQAEAAAGIQTREPSENPQSPAKDTRVETSVCIETETEAALEVVEQEGLKVSSSDESNVFAGSNVSLQEPSDIEMMDVDSSFLMEEEIDQTPEKKSAGDGFFISSGMNPSALAPLSPAAVNAGHAAPTANEYAKPEGTQTAESTAPPETPARSTALQFQPTSAAGRFQLSHLSYVPKHSSPLKRPPLTYSPSEATPPPRKRRINENGIISRSCDPSPLRPEELSNTDSDSVIGSPTPRASRRVASPVARKRSRSRSVRRESSPLKNAVQFTTQDGPEEAETSRKGAGTPKRSEVMTPLPRHLEYDPDAEISELREDEITMSPLSELQAQNILSDVQSPMGEGEGEFSGLGALMGLDVDNVHISPDLLDMSFPALSEVSMSFEVPERVAELLLAGTPSPQTDADIPLSSPMGTPMPVRPSEPKRAKIEGRHSTGSLPAAKGKAEGSRRTTISGPIDVTTGPARDIKHPRAFEARQAYLGPPPVVSTEDYQSQFKASTLSDPSTLNDADISATRAENMSAVSVGEILKDAEVALKDNSVESKAQGPSRFGTDGTDDLPEPSFTEVADPETKAETPQPDSEGSAFSDTPSDPLSSDASNDDSGLMEVPKGTSTSNDRTTSPKLPVETGPKRRLSDPASRPDKKSRIPLFKSSLDSSSTGSPFSARLNRVSQTKNLSDRELSKVTARNTTRNGVYKNSKFERKVVRLPGERPPSPTRDTQSAAAEDSRWTRKRVFEETGVALGPGDEPDYVPPELSPSVKKVKWHSLLERALDESEKARFQTNKGILAPERVRRDSTSVHEITIQKFLYEGERDIYDEDYEEEH
ncbi:hypothetical protein ABW20_dc0105842 [Dactylellina cionopaga]|nr:hypothetical protein ABW20_dc0105842 [Dactylellina cionopaga]